MNWQPNENKAQKYNELMFKFQRVQEQIKDIETGNVVESKNTPQQLVNLKNQLRMIQGEIQRLY
jgi:hypothetical protein